MADGADVRFELFGGLRAYKNGQSVSLPDATAGTYLRLLLLSGEPFLNNGEGRRMGTSDSMRAVVDRSNRPKREGQWGQWDFSQQTGLEFRFREPAGICLIGEGWTSDIHDFESIWHRRSLATLDELQHALKLSQEGIAIETWPKEPVFKDCLEWTRARVNELYEYRVQISEEISRRKQAEAGASDAASNIGPDHSRGGLRQEEDTSPAETSGLDSGAIESGEDGKTSTPLREAVREQSSASLPSETDRVTPFDQSQPWVLTWIHENGTGESDSSKLNELRAIYRFVDQPAMLNVLQNASTYVFEMYDLDSMRARNLFVESHFDRLIRFVKSRLVLDRNDLNSFMNVELQARQDANPQQWDNTVARERARREARGSDTGNGVSFPEKRFNRACVVRSCQPIESRSKQLVQNCKSTSEGRRDLPYMPAYEGEIEKMFDFLIGLVHLQGFKIVELQKAEKRQGGIDPRSLTLLAGESLEARRYRAEHKTWDQNVLVDAIAVPDWSLPIAKSLGEQQRQVVEGWAEARARFEEEMQRERAAKESLPPDRPIPYRERKGQRFIIGFVSLVSSWVTFVGIAGLIARYFMNTNEAEAVSYSLWSVVGPGLVISAFLGLPVWLPMSYAFFHSYSNAVMDGKIRSAVGFPTLLLICSVGIIVFFAIARP